ncbi:hypothetical protein SEA_DARDANUS_47 [Gordonia phage Dardanus]|uniref:Helix-turn-helix DNA binding domain protein n=1 Tax=Gordonia phage Dardanus TaxID=2588489 RepID=A0A514CX43_9CAUD|nr:replication initiation protein [Gordonia phage Dardanus]QDH85084.1 hypothetical protein SEA_DARDANUS_47 [Gordonia phage Dardanus]
MLSIPKRQRAAAVGLWVLAGAWSARELTDGYVPDFMLAELSGTKALAGCLVDAGLWDRLDNGFIFRQWSKYNPTGEQVRSDRRRKADWVARKRSAVRAARETSCEIVETSTDDDVSTVDTLSSRPSVDDVSTDVYSVPTRPDPIKRTNTADSDPEGFAEWWAAYPKKAGKGQARTAYRKARKSVDAATLLDGAERYRDDPKRNPEYTKNPATWLNGECWADQGAERARPNNAGRRFEFD